VCVFALLSLASLVGCSSQPRSGTPDDFAIGVIVPSAMTDPQLEAGWVVLDADGTVRQFAGEVTRATRLPRRATTISRERLDAMHDRLAAANVLTYGAVGEPVGDASAAITMCSTVGVWWAANDRRRSFLLSPQLADDVQTLGVIAEIYRELRTESWEQVR